MWELFSCSPVITPLLPPHTPIQQKHESCVSLQSSSRRTSSPDTLGGESPTEGRQVFAGFTGRVGGLEAIKEHPTTPGQVLGQALPRFTVSHILSNIDNVIIMAP